jgi:Domain of unknown function (DUF4304)
MNAAEFRKLSNAYLAPRMRELGWQGSGFDFRDFGSAPLVKILGIQGTWHGGSVCCETAIYYDFFNKGISGKIDVKKIRYYSGIIRKRLSPRGGGDYWWTFRDKPEDNIASIDQIWNAFITHGLAFYKDFENFPEPFLNISPRDLKGNVWGPFKLLGKYHIENDLLFTYFLQEFNKYIDRPSIAGGFSAYGIERTNYWGKLHFTNKRGEIDTDFLNSNLRLFDK